MLKQHNHTHSDFFHFGIFRNTIPIFSILEFFGMIWIFYLPNKIQYEYNIFPLHISLNLFLASSTTATININSIITILIFFKNALRNLKCNN